MNLKVRLGSAALPSLLSLGCLALLASGVLDPIELVTLDWRFRLTPRPHASPEICVIELDQKSFSRIGQWPWPRTRHAALLDALHAAGARMVGLDILFSEQSGPTTDRALAEAMQRAGNIYLPIVFNTAPPKDSLPDILLPLEQFRVCARGLGFINFYSDSDGVNRSIPLILRCAGRDYPQLAFSMACDYLGVPGRDISLRAGRDLTLTPSGGHPIRIPLAAGTTTIINWAGRWDSSFARYSFCDVVDAYNSRRPGALLPSPLGDFKGKIVFVGLTAPGAFDSQPVPVEANYPNLGLHVNLLNSILVNRFITRMGKGWEALFVILIIVLMCRLLPLLQPLRALLAAMVIFVLTAAAAYGLFCWAGIWLESIYLFAGVPLCYIVIITHARITAAREQARLWALAHHDTLTGLYQMRYFTERLGAELSLRGGGRGRVSLILLSIDRLKELNDNYGTPLGDYTLSEIATLIRLLLPANTLLARFERDAFVIMVCDRGEAELRRLAGKLMSAVAASSFTYGGTVHRVTLSIGIVTSRGEEASLLIQRADNTLFEAKEEGGNSVCAHC